MAGLVRPTLFFVCILAAHFFSEQEVLCTKGLKRTTRERFSYANFVDHLFCYLNITQVGSYLMQKLEDCSTACVRSVSCFSFNVAAHPDKNGHILCELLTSDKYNSSDKFQPNPSFHHYSIFNPCSEVPCKNGGACIALYDHGDFECKCRLGFKGKNCEMGCVPVGVEDVNKIPDSSMNASGYYDTRYYPHYARLHRTSTRGWCPTTTNSNNTYLQVYLKTEHAVCAVATQGAHGIDEWATGYKLAVSPDGIAWFFYKEDNKDKEFPGNVDQDTVVKNQLNAYVDARYVRFYPVAQSRWPAMRVEIFVLKKRWPGLW